MKQIPMHICLILVFVVVSRACPDGCVCNQQVICSRLKEFPKTFKTDAKSITIDQSTLSTIPAGAFKNVMNLESIVINLSKIGTIESHAFENLQNMTSVSVYQSSIQRIASYAFTNINFKSQGPTDTYFSMFLMTINDIQPNAFSSIRDGKRFTLYNSNITTIETLGFYKITGFTEFSMYKNNIQRVKSMAFINLNMNDVIRIYDLYIKRLDCGTLEYLIFYLDEKLTTFDFEVNCDCSLVWLQPAIMRSTSIVQNKTLCRGPEELSRKRISDVTLSSACPSGTSFTFCSVNDQEKCSSSKLGSSSWKYFMGLQAMILLLCHI